MKLLVWLLIWRINSCKNIEYDQNFLKKLALDFEDTELPEREYLITMISIFFDVKVIE